MKIAQKSRNRLGKLKLIESMQVSTWLSNIAFHLWPTDLAANFGCDRFKIMSESSQTSFPSFGALPFEVEIWNWADAPFLGQGINLDLLFCTGFDLEHAFLSFAQRPMNFRMLIEALIWLWLTTTSRQISVFTEPNQYCKSGSTFFLKRARSRGECSRLGNALFGNRQSLSQTLTHTGKPKLCRSSARRGGPLILQSKLLIVFWNSHSRWQAGAWTWTQTWTLPSAQRVVKVLSALKSKNNLCGVWILLGQLKFENAEIEDSSESYQPSSTRLMLCKGLQGPAWPWHCWDPSQRSCTALAMPLPTLLPRVMHQVSYVGPPKPLWASRILSCGYAHQSWPTTFNLSITTWQVRQQCIVALCVDCSNLLFRPPIFDMILCKDFVA